MGQYRIPSPAERAHQAHLRRRRIRAWTILALVAMIAIPPIPRGLVWLIEHGGPALFVAIVGLLVYVGRQDPPQRRRR